MSESEKIRRLREAVENASPELAAAAAAARFEREAITVPGELHVGADAPKWQRRLYADAGRLYRELVIAEPGGLTKVELLAASYMAQGPFEKALKVLRSTGLVLESTTEAGGGQTLLFRPRGATT